MTRKQELFAAEYLVDFNATQAAIRAGYSKKTAHSIGDENLKKPEIKQLIEKMIDERQTRLGITQDEVLRDLCEVKDKSLGRIPVNGAYMFNPGGANKALELIGKHLGMFTEKLNIETEGGTGVIVLPEINGGEKDKTD